MNTLKEKIIYFISIISLFFIILMVYKNYSGIYGDAIQQLSSGRAFPIPIWGTWIPERVFGDFFANLLFQIYFDLFAPLFNIHHIADVYSTFMSTIYGLNFIFLSLACFKYSKLFITLEAKHYFIYSLVFYVLFMVKMPYTNITLTFAYNLPFTVGVWFIYPFIAYVATKNNVLELMCSYISISYAEMSIFSNT